MAVTYRICLSISHTYLAFLGVVSGWQHILYRSTASVGVRASVSSHGASHSSVTSGARAGDVCDPYPSEFSCKYDCHLTSF